jgi:hypothetical protein
MHLLLSVCFTITYINTSGPPSYQVTKLTEGMLLSWHLLQLVSCLPVIVRVWQAQVMLTIV